MYFWKKSIFVDLLVATLTHAFYDVTKLFSPIYSATKFGNLQSIIDQLIKEKLFQQEQIRCLNSTHQFKEDLSYLLQSRFKALINIKNKVTHLEGNYSYDYDIKKFFYYNTANKPPNPVQINILYSEKVEVSTERSHVQVPTEIYRYDKRILNSITMTKALDAVYLKNFQESPTLLWQYFCDVNGAFRIYPGENTKRKVDLYDCRRRLWYNQAINSPKDIVVALDMSGSMTGYHFTIAKLIIHSLIDTLQQDDFFNVLLFDKDTKYLIDCLKVLSQATSSNKEIFKTAVSNLPNPNGVANFPNALKSAFQMIELSSQKDTTSSQCSKIIMVVSDGIDYNEHTHEILAQYNSEKNVSIFSYIVGRDPSPEMKDLACNNGGSYYQFPTVGNVLDGVLKYQKNLSKPLANSNEEYVIFTPLYLDGSGLGMMTTISTAVFSKKDQHLIGVAGMDIVVSLLKQQYPLQRMGVFGHAFAINNNGLFLMHPKFKDQSGYLPDPATVYLDEVEHTVDPMKGLEIKKAMIDGKTGCMEGVESDWLYPRNLNKRVVRLNNTYCYQPMNNTPFYAGVSMPVQNKLQMVANKSKSHIYMTSGIDSLVSNNPNQRNEIARWLFCNFSTEGEKQQPASIKYYPTAKDLKEYLKNRSANNLTDCNEQMLFTLLLSASTIMNFTSNEWSLSFLKEHNALDVYVISTAGFMTQFSQDINKSKPLDREIFEEERFTHPASFFKPDQRRKLVFTVDFKIGDPLFNPSDNNTVAYVSMGRAIYANESEIIMAVAGMTVPSKKLNELMLNTSLCNASCNPDSFDCMPCHCNNSKRYKCYMVDENGYVVSSNQNNYQVGYFLGYFDGRLVKKLVKDNIFERRLYNDTQAQCHSHTVTHKSPGNVLRNFYENLFNFVHVTISYITSMFWWILINIISPQTYVAGVNDEDSRNISCTKQIQIYIFNDSINSHRGEINCHNCKQRFLVQTIPETNLALIITNDNCSICPQTIVSNDPVKIKDIDICYRNENYRKPLKKCYESTGLNNKQCVYTNTEKSPNIVIYLVVFLSICFAVVTALGISYYCRSYVHGKF